MNDSKANQEKIDTKELSIDKLLRLNLRDIIGYNEKILTNNSNKIEIRSNDSKELDEYREFLDKANSSMEKDKYNYKFTWDDGEWLEDDIQSLLYTDIGYNEGDIEDKGDKGIESVRDLHNIDISIYKNIDSDGENFRGFGYV